VIHLKAHVYTVKLPKNHESCLRFHLYGIQGTPRDLTGFGVPQFFFVLSTCFHSLIARKKQIRCQIWLFRDLMDARKFTGTLIIPFHYTHVSVSKMCKIGVFCPSESWLLFYICLYALYLECLETKRSVRVVESRRHSSGQSTLAKALITHSPAGLISYYEW
jgi:hypothetical protein